MFHKFYFIFVLLFIHIDFCTCYQTDEGTVQNNDQLIFAHIIYRHGNRSPLKSYLNDPYNSKLFWPNGLNGQLTQKGLKAHLELGKYLRKRYYKLLDDGKYDADKVYIRSSDYDRTILSANANLLGFFPIEEHEVWTDELRWRPIPIHTVPKKLDHIVSSERPCARYNKAFKEIFNLPEYLAYRSKAERYTKLIMDNTKPKNVTEEFSVWEALYTQYLENLTLPSWTEDMMNSDSTMSIFIRHLFKMLTHTTEMKKLKSGFLLKEMLERFAEKAEAKLSPDHRLYIYSGHDNTISNLLNALNLYDSHMPPYASCLFFELYNSNEGRKENVYVQLFYKNTSAEDFPPLNIPGCGTKCSLEEFHRLFRDVLPTEDFETECKLPSEPNSIQKIEPFPAIICAITFAFSMLFGWRR
ncbi:prostatic acid phosphatase-like [Contarinia nasturtii]|uniref:prostatic acid phosphatase-like n=1 Tax=Contarinia nasturtii TaxID=265458 RepID=UPI0012D3FB46|nr:prostatic acid phosphatase-like [Contarinia nasturtii]